MNIAAGTFYYKVSQALLLEIPRLLFPKLFNAVYYFNDHVHFPPNRINIIAEILMLSALVTNMC